MDQQQQRWKLQGVEDQGGDARRHHALVGLQDPSGVPGAQEQGHALDKQKDVDGGPAQIELRDRHDQAIGNDGKDRL